MSTQVSCCIRVKGVNQYIFNFKIFYVLPPSNDTLAYPAVMQKLFMIITVSHLTVDTETGKWREGQLRCVTMAVEAI